jgi:hypothetical protein
VYRWRSELVERESSCTHTRAELLTFQVNVALLYTSFIHTISCVLHGACILLRMGWRGRGSVDDRWMHREVRLNRCVWFERKMISPPSQVWTIKPAVMHLSLTNNRGPCFEALSSDHTVHQQQLNVACARHHIHAQSK